MTGYSVERRETVADLGEFIAECIDIPKFLACCQQCERYNNRWSCPPFDFDPMEIWRKYRGLRLYALILRPEGIDGRALIAALHGEKPGFDRWLAEMEQAEPGSFYLSGGTCYLCQDCQRETGRPCLYPEKLRYSIEALGGDVGMVSERYFGMPMQWVADGRAPEYLMLVGGLLLP